MPGELSLTLVPLARSLHACLIGSSVGESVLPPADMLTFTVQVGSHKWHVLTSTSLRRFGMRNAGARWDDGAVSFVSLIGIQSLGINNLVLHSSSFPSAFLTSLPFSAAV